MRRVLAGLIAIATVILFAGCADSPTSSRPSRIRAQQLLVGIRALDGSRVVAARCLTSAGHCRLTTARRHRYDCAVGFTRSGRGVDGAYCARRAGPGGIEFLPANGADSRALRSISRNGGLCSPAAVKRGALLRGVSPGLRRELEGIVRAAHGLLNTCVNLHATIRASR